MTDTQRVRTADEPVDLLRRHPDRPTAGAA